MKPRIPSLDQVARRPMDWGGLITAAFALLGIVGLAVLVAAVCARAVFDALTGLH